MFGEMTIFRIILLGVFLFLGRKVWKGFIKNGELYENIAYKGKNVVVEVLQEGDNPSDVVICSSGYNFELDEKNRVIKHDPLMFKPDNPFKDRNVKVLNMYFTFNATGLEDAAKEMAEYINNNLQDYRVTLIGHSKSGVCFVATTKWLKEKVNIITISAPFNGTILADKENFSKRLGTIGRFLYNQIFSNHKVDQDIAPHSKFLANLDYNCLKSHNYVNIISKVEITANPIDILLYVLNTCQNINGDGIVSRQSQELSLHLLEYTSISHSKEMQEKKQATTKYCGARWNICASHASSMLKGMELVKNVYFKK